MYLAVQYKVKTMLNNARDVAITTDIWTSMNTESYITITVHFLIQARLKTLVLRTKKLECSHTAVNICDLMTEELKKWNVFDKVVAVVTDGGANIKAAVRLIKLSHVPCTAHKLNSVIQQSLLLCDNEEIRPVTNTN